MAAAFQLPVTAAQVGTYFVGRYYHVLQHQPEFVHQFYSDASTALRIDGNARDTATTMLHIHALVMSLNYSAIEIKTTHSLESWKSGVLVMVSGTVHVNDYNRRRKFMQTFFLAPQEKGYFILNDIFHFVEEEQLVQHPVAYLAPGNLDPNLSASTAILGQASNYVHDGGFQSREYVDGGFQQSREYVDGGFQQSREYVDGGFQQSREYVDGGFQSREYIDGGFQSREYVDGGFQSREYVVPEIEENGLPDEYGFSEERLQNVHEADKVLEDNFAGQSNGSLHSGVKPLQDHLSVPVDEAVGGGAQKLTYASILAKGQAAQASVEKAASSLSEWQNVSDSSVHHSSGPSSNVVERHVVEPVEEAAEDEVEVKSVYVKNVPTTMAASEIEVEFKKFGRLRPDGVAIRTRKDIDICYAFVEFEDISGVQNAIQASVVEIDGHRLYIEGRRPNRGILIRGRGRGRGRVGYYPMDGGSRGGGGGRFSGRFFGRGNNNSQDQVRNNGFYRQASRQDY